MAKKTKKPVKAKKPANAKKPAKAPKPAKAKKPTPAGGNMCPCLRYEDAPRAIDWLCAAFGFEKHLVVPGPNGTVAHAQLRLGTGMVMLGSDDRSSEFGVLFKKPGEVGAVTQAAYVVVKEIDAHYARAKENGATIVLEIRDQDYGGRDYTCKDLEGHVWSFGSYDPWS